MPISQTLISEGFMAHLHIQFEASTVRGAADDKCILDFQNQPSLSNVDPPFLLLPHLAPAPIACPHSPALFFLADKYTLEDDQRDPILPQEQFQLMELCSGKITAPKCSICKKPTGENTTLIKRRPIAGKPLNGFNVLVCMFWEPAISL